MTTDLPIRNPEGWAVVDLMGRTRLVGRVQLVKMGDATLLEIEQPTIRAGQNRRYSTDNPEFTVLEAHTVVVNPANLYKLTPVPSLEHCVNAFFDVYDAYSLIECPKRWSSETHGATQPTGIEWEDDDDIPV